MNIEIGHFWMIIIISCQFYEVSIYLEFILLKILAIFKYQAAQIVEFHKAYAKCPIKSRQIDLFLRPLPNIASFFVHKQVQTFKW